MSGRVRETQRKAERRRRGAAKRREIATGTSRNVRLRKRGRDKYLPRRQRGLHKKGGEQTRHEKWGFQLPYSAGGRPGFALLTASASSRRCKTELLSLVELASSGPCCCRIPLITRPCSHNVLMAIPFLLPLVKLDTLSLCQILLTDSLIPLSVLCVSSSSHPFVCSSLFLFWFFCCRSIWTGLPHARASRSGPVRSGPSWRRRHHHRLCYPDMGLDTPPARARVHTLCTQTEREKKKHFKADECRRKEKGGGDPSIRGCPG